MARKLAFTVTEELGPCVHIASPATAFSARPLAKGAYENGLRCTDWYPNVHTCGNIFNCPAATDAQN